MRCYQQRYVEKLGRQYRLDMLIDEKVDRTENDTVWFKSQSKTLGYRFVMKAIYTPNQRRIASFARRSANDFEFFCNEFVEQTIDTNAPTEYEEYEDGVPVWVKIVAEPTTKVMTNGSTVDVSDWLHWVSTNNTTASTYSYTVRNPHRQRIIDPIPNNEFVLRGEWITDEELDRLHNTIRRDNDPVQ